MVNARTTDENPCTRHTQERKVQMNRKIILMHKGQSNDTSADLKNNRKTSRSP